MKKNSNRIIVALIIIVVIGGAFLIRNHAYFAFFQANKLYDAGGYYEAIQRYPRPASCHSEGFCHQTYHNIGNSYYRYGETKQGVDQIDQWQLAVDMYNHSLTFIQDEKTEKNRNFVLDKIKEWEDSQQDNEQNQEGEQQPGEGEQGEDGQESESGENDQNSEQENGEQEGGDQSEQSDSEQGEEGQDSQEGESDESSEQETGEQDGEQEGEQSESEQGEQSTEGEQLEEGSESQTEGQDGEQSGESASSQPQQPLQSEYVREQLEQYREFLQEEQLSNQQFFQVQPMGGQGSQIREIERDW